MGSKKQRPSMYFGSCPETGKRGYGSRKDARTARKQAASSADPYECKHCGMWHLGHLKHSVSRAAYRHENHDEQKHLRVVSRELGVPIPTLSAACQHLGIKVFNAHISEHDYRMLARLTWTE